MVHMSNLVSCGGINGLGSVRGVHVALMDRPRSNRAAQDGMGRCSGEDQRKTGYLCSEVSHSFPLPVVKGFSSVLLWHEVQSADVFVPRRYSDQYRFRPAASPIVTETLANGRTRIHGARHGDQIPLPKPTGTEAIKAKRKERRKKKNKKN